MDEGARCARFAGNSCMCAGWRRVQPAGRYPAPPSPRPGSSLPRIKQIHPLGGAANFERIFSSSEVIRSRSRRCGSAPKSVPCAPACRNSTRDIQQALLALPEDLMEASPGSLAGERAATSRTRFDVLIIRI